MAIGVETPKVTYTGNGSTTVFPLNFSYDSVSHVKIHVDNILIESGLTVNDADVSFDTAPLSEESIVITRETPRDQPSPLDEPQTTSLAALESILDRVVMIIQEISQGQYEEGGYTQEQIDNLIEPLTSRVNAAEADIQENVGDIENLENSPSNSNLLIVEDEAEKISTALNTSKVLFQKSSRGLYDVQTVIAEVGDWSRNSAKDLNSFTYQGWFSSDGSRLFARNSDNTGIDEYVVDTIGQPENGITAASGSNSLPSTQCIEITPDGTKALVVPFANRDSIEIYDLTVNQSLNGGMTLNSTWSADNNLGSMNAVYSLRFKSSDPKRILATRRDGNSVIHIEEFQLNIDGDLTSFDASIGYEIGNESGFPAVGAEYISDNQVLYLQSNNLMKRFDIEKGFAKEIESLTFSSDPQDYAPSNTGSLHMLSTGVLYIGSASSVYNKLYAYDNIGEEAWVLIDFVEDVTKNWNLATSETIANTVSTGTYDLSTLSQWAADIDDVSSANFAIVVATSKFSTDRLNGGTNGNEYGIKITASGVLVADSSYIKGTLTTDADDSGVLISPGVPYEIPIIDGTIPYVISKTVHGVGGSPAEDVHDLKLVGFKRCLEI